MDIENEIKKLLKAKKRMEKKLKELDAKLDHLIFLHKESRQCLARKCPLEESEDGLTEFWYRPVSVRHEISRNDEN